MKKAEVEKASLATEAAMVDMDSPADLGVGLEKDKLAAEEDGSQACPQAAASEEFKATIKVEVKAEVDEAGVATEAVLLDVADKPAAEEDF